MQETWVQSLGWEDTLEKGKSTQTYYSGLENSKDYIVHGVAKSLASLSDFHFHWIPVAQLLKNPLAMQETPRFNSWVRKIPWRRDRPPSPIFLGFSCGSAGKESACKAGNLGSTPGLARSPGEGKGYPLQYSGLENAMNCIVHGVTKSWTRLSNFHFYLFGYQYYQVFIFHDLS